MAKLKVTKTVRIEARRDDVTDAFGVPKDAEVYLVWAPYGEAEQRVNLSDTSFGSGPGIPGTLIIEYTEDDDGKA